MVRVYIYGLQVFIVGLLFAAGYLTGMSVAIALTIFGLIHLEQQILEWYNE